MNRLILFFLILYCWGSKSQQKNNLYGSFFSNGVYYGESEDNDFNEDLTIYLNRNNALDQVLQF